MGSPTRVRKTTTAAKRVSVGGTIFINYQQTNTIMKVAIEGEVQVYVR